MVAYSQFHRLEEDVAQVFVQVVRAMDAVFLAWQAEEMENKRKENATPDAR